MANITKNIALSVAVFVAAVTLLSGAGPAQAGNFVRTFIKSTGSDTNAGSGCQPSAPCQTFNGAISATLEGGEVNCLDPSEAPIENTVPITISQEITIDCHGSFGAHTSSQVNGLVINASGAVVTIRGLNLSGLSGYQHSALVGLSGVLIQAAAVVNIEDCVVENFARSGVSDQRSGSGQLFIRNTVLRNNGGNTNILSSGINITPGTGVTITASIDKSQISSNYFGIVGDGRSGGIIRATISDSVVSGNTQNAVTAITSASSVWFLLDQTKVAENAFGLVAGGGGARILARYSSVFNNTTGLFTNNGGALITYGTNSVAGNATNGMFTATAGLQ